MLGSYLLNVLAASPQRLHTKAKGLPAEIYTAGTRGPRGVSPGLLDFLEPLGQQIDSVPSFPLGALFCD